MKYFWVVCLASVTMVSLSHAEPEEEISVNRTWVDSSRDYARESADAFALWFDGFFGDQRYDEDSPYSSLRLSIENDWVESEGNDGRVRLRGRLYLPQFNEKLSVVFSDEEDVDLVNNNLSNEGREEDTNLDLQFTNDQQKNHRIDYRLGLRSSFKGRASVRYRYNDIFFNSYLGRLSQRVQFIDGDGFESRTRVDIERSIDEKKLLRWSNQVEIAEEVDGVEWVSTIQRIKRISSSRAISYFLSVNGETRPDYLVTSYGFGLRYRQSIFRPWLFIEVDPALAWVKDEKSDDREPQASLDIKLEIFFDDRTIN